MKNKSFYLTLPVVSLIEFGEVRKVTVSRPDRLRTEVERSDGEKGLVVFNGKDLTVPEKGANQ